MKTNHFKNTFFSLILITIGLSVFAQAQESAIGFGQINAIKQLAKNQGFTEASLDEYLIQEKGLPLTKLTRKDGAELIRLFQSSQTPTPADIKQPEFIQSVAKETTRKQLKRKIAELLEVGMAKRFHLVDGNIIKGEIVKIEDGVCYIETIDGLLYIPSEDILEETARITKKDDTRYIGPVLRETKEEIIIRSKYGDVVISKKDVKDMDRYNGGRLVPWAEEKKTFYRGKVVLTDIFMDPTAFPLEMHTFYISGLSLGYGFTERFMIRSKFGSDFSGDLNFQPLLRFYNRRTATSNRAAAVGMELYSHHSMETLVAKYAKYIIEDSTNTSLDEIEDKQASDILLNESKKQFYWEFYFVLSSRRSLATERGEAGWHVGFRTNSLLLQKPELESGYKWEGLSLPFRLWAAFEYDLSKNLKLAALIWADNGHKFRTFSQAWDDYLGETPFILDSKVGEYRMVDFDFGFLYSATETFTIGIHFQEPYMVFYWEFFEL